MQSTTYGHQPASQPITLNASASNLPTFVSLSLSHSRNPHLQVLATLFRTSLTAVDVRLAAVQREGSRSRSSVLGQFYANLNDPHARTWYMYIGNFGLNPISSSSTLGMTRPRTPGHLRPDLPLAYYTVLHLDSYPWHHRVAHPLPVSRSRTCVALPLPLQILRLLLSTRAVVQMRGPNTRSRFMDDNIDACTCVLRLTSETRAVALGCLISKLTSLFF